MEVEKFRGYITAIVAAVLAVGSVALAAWAWNQPIDPENPKDLLVLYTFIGVVFGATSAWLFGAEAASRATHAAERSHAAGQAAGAGTTNGHSTATTAVVSGEGYTITGTPAPPSGSRTMHATPAPEPDLDRVEGEPDPDTDERGDTPAAPA